MLLILRGLIEIWRVEGLDTLFLAGKRGNYFQDLRLPTRKGRSGVSGDAVCDALVGLADVGLFGGAPCVPSDDAAGDGLVHLHPFVPKAQLAIVFYGHLPGGRVPLVGRPAGPVLHSLLLAESFDFLKGL